MVDVVYKPVKCIHEIIGCCFTTEINLAFIVRYLCGKNDRLRSGTSFVFYYCGAFCVGKKVFEKHLVNCARKPGIVYKFNNQHLTTFEDNFKLMGDQPFSVYFGLETTCGKTNFALDLDDDSADMYVVSYCFIIAFHKTYSLSKITVLRSFNDTFVDLADLSCLSNEMLELRDNATTSQLYNCIQNVVSKKTRYALMEMLCC